MGITNFADSSITITAGSRVLSAIWLEIARTAIPTAEINISESLKFLPVHALKGESIKFNLESRLTNLSGTKTRASKFSARLNAKFMPRLVNAAIFMRKIFVI